MANEHEVHFGGKVAQKAILTDGERILITRDVGDPDTWELPGGRLNADELPPAGLAREIYEELGVDIDVGVPVYIEQFYHERDQANMLLIAYEATRKDPAQEFSFGPDEVAEVKWITRDELDHQHLFADMRRALEQYFTLAK